MQVRWLESWSLVPRGRLAKVGNMRAFDIANMGKIANMGNISNPILLPANIVTMQNTSYLGSCKEDNEWYDLLKETQQ